MKYLHALQKPPGVRSAVFSGRSSDVLSGSSFRESIAQPAPRSCENIPQPSDALPTSESFPHSWEELAQLAEYRANRLASLCNVSLRTLERLFKRRYQLPVSTWLRCLRMRLAYDRIRSGEAVKEVAYDLGFKQLSHFSREFKKAHGVTARSVASCCDTPLKKLLFSDLERTATFCPAGSWSFSPSSSESVTQTYTSAAL